VGELGAVARLEVGQQVELAAVVGAVAAAALGRPPGYADAGRKSLQLAGLAALGSA
jgi:hypothetical protein